VSVVILVQALLFADGGLTAIGVNVVDMSLITVVVGYAVFRGLVRLLPYSRRTVVGSAFVAAFVSVPVSALGFVGFYALGGTTDVSLSTVLTAMLGVHVLIGLGEGLITALTVGSVVAVRPDLVAGVRDRLPVLDLQRTSPVATARAAGGTVPDRGKP
jgi:cobalt/nickel transport system permease protein